MDLGLERFSQQLDRLAKEKERVPTSKLERIQLAHQQAKVEGRWPEMVRLLGMMPAEGSKAPTMDSMVAMANGIAARLAGTTTP